MPLFPKTVVRAMTSSEARSHRPFEKFIIRAMKLTAIILLLFSLHVSANLQSQVTLSAKNAPLEKVLASINKQTGFHFIYGEGILAEAGNITIHVKNVSVEEAIKACLKDKNLTYEIQDKVVVIKKKIILHEEIKVPNPPIDVKGKVLDEKGDPVAGASVTIKGTNKGTSTNANGEFELGGVEEKSVLVISGVNIQRQEITVNGESNISIRVKLAVSEEEEVVVAYNKISQRSNTGAVNVVKGEQIQTLPNRSFDKSLQGMVPGLLVTSGTGQPGSGVSNFVLRGVATASDDALKGSAVRNPLIVIDGIPVSQEQFQLYIDVGQTPISNPLAQLNSSDIESISVLKDAAAIALYGSRASNGVMVVTTKKGKAGKTKFTFRHQTDIASELNGKVDVLNKGEYLTLVYESYKNQNPSITDAEIKADLVSKFPTIVTSGGNEFYPGTDWNDAIFNPHAATFSNEIAVSGGSEKVNYYANLEYTKQNGIIRETGYDRKSFRFNFENRANDWFKYGFNSTFSYNVQHYHGTLRGAAGPFNNSISPLNPVYAEDGSVMFNFKNGSITSGPFANPVAERELNINRNRSYRGLGKLFAEVSFLKDFKFTTAGGIDYLHSDIKEKTDPRLIDPGQNYALGGRIEQQNLRRANAIVTNLLRFDHLWSSHSVNFIAGQEAQVLTQNNIFIAIKGLSSPFYDQITSPGTTPLRQGGAEAKERLLSYFGNANYAFLNRYFLSASVRRDGSSRFGEERRYGTYWSAGAGWVVSSEPFMKTLQPLISYFKIRGSVGEAGNAGAINATVRYDALQPTTYQGATAVYPVTTPGNPEVKWENTFTWDGGVELRLLKERLSVTLDLYRRKTTDLLYLLQLAQSTGYYQVLTNIGEMSNKGVEISLFANIVRTKDWNWSLGGNWATNKNVLVKANSHLPFNATNVIYNQEGENFNSFYLRRWAGVNPVDGSSQWMDSAGKASNDYNAAKREFVGKPQPDAFGSLSNIVTFKQFQLSAIVYFQYGYHIYNADGLVNDGSNPYANQDVRALDRWQKPGDQSANPKRVKNSFQGTQPSTRFLFKGDHLRLQNVTFSYNFPKGISDRLRTELIRLYVQGNNLAIWTLFPGSDPSNINVGGTVGTVYPAEKSYSFGVQINF